MSVWTTVRSKTGVVVMSLGVLAAAGLGTVANVITSPASDQQPAGEVFVAPTSDAPAPTTTEAPPTVAPAPVTQQQAAVTQAPTVQTVTEPAPETTSAPNTIPAPQLNPDGSLPEGWKPPMNPGEPPIAPQSPPSLAEKLPGEGDPFAAQPAR